MPLGGYLRTAALLVVLEGLLRVLGAVQQAVFGALFGVGPELDALFVALAMPNLLVTLLVLGPLGVAVIPAFMRRPRAEAQTLLAALLGLLALAGLVALVAGAVLAPWYAAAAGAGLADQQREWVTLLLRLMIPTVLLAAFNATLRGVCHAHGWFLTPVSGFLASGVTLIVVVLLLTPWLHLAAVPVGFLVGGLVALAVQVGMLARRGAGVRIGWPAPGSGVASLVGPALLLGLAMALVQANGLWARAYAAWLPPGSVSLLEYAAGFDRAIGGVAAASVGAAAYPSMASADPQQMAAGLRRALRSTWLAALLATVLVLALRRPLIAVWLEHGRFGAAEGDALAGLLLFLGPAYLAWAMTAPLLYAFHARGRLGAPVLVTAGCLAAGAAAGLVTGPWLGLPGLAATLATTVCSTVLLLLLAVRVFLVGSPGSWGSFLAQSLLAGGLAAAVATAAAGLPNALMSLLAGGGLGVVTYVSLLRALGVEEAVTVTKALQQRALSGR